MPRLLLVLALAVPLIAPGPAPSPVKSPVGLRIVQSARLERASSGASLARRAVAFVRDDEVMGDASPAVLAYGANVTSGSALVVLAYWNTIDTPTIADTLLSTWTLQCGGIKEAAGGNMAIWTSPNSGGGADTVTLTEVGATFELMYISEISGAATSSIVDVCAATFDTSVSPATVTTAAMSQNDGYVLGFAVNGTLDLTTGSTFTMRHDDSNNQFHLVEDKVVSAGGTQTCTATFSASSDWGVICMVLKAAGGGPAFPAGIINALLRGGGWR